MRPLIVEAQLAAVYVISSSASSGQRSYSYRKEFHVGAIIAIINLAAAKEVWQASREEHDSVVEDFEELDED